MRLCLSVMGAYDADADQDHGLFGALERDPGAEPGGGDDGVSVCVCVCVCVLFQVWVWG